MVVKQITYTKYVNHMMTHTDNKYNKAFIDIRLHPGIATPLVAVGQRFSHPRIALWPIMAKVTSSIKPEVHNVLQHHQRRTEGPSHGHRGSAQKML